MIWAHALNSDIKCLPDSAGISVATEPNRTTPNRTKLRIRFDRPLISSFRSAREGRSVRFDSVPLVKRWIGSIRFEDLRIEPNQLSNRFDSLGSVWTLLRALFPMAMHVKRIPRFVMDFHAFRAFKMLKFHCICDGDDFGRGSETTVRQNGERTLWWLAMQVMVTILRLC
jgi:hypothetical protein